MSILEQIAYYQNRRDEVPNQELAAQLAQAGDSAGISEIAAHLQDPSQAVASDCLKVLYEIGYIQPALIQDYAAAFLGLLNSSNSRMVWGAMIALSTIAKLKPDEIWAELELVLETIRKGTVITEVSGIKTLVGICTARSEYRARLLPYLLEMTAASRPVDLPTRVETILPVATGAESRSRLLEIIASKLPALKPSAQRRLAGLARKIANTAESHKEPEHEHGTTGI
jgi:hypothetical protein